MLTSFITSLVELSRRFAAFVVCLAVILSFALGDYTVKNIKINTDINQLLSDKLDFQQREKELDQAFPQKIDNLVIVIDSDNTDRSESAAAALASKLAAMPDKFTYVSRPDALPYFRANGLLLLSKESLATVLDQAAAAQPLLATIVSDPSLRGFFGMIGLMIQGVQSGQSDAAQLELPLATINETLKAAIKGQDRPLDLTKMMPMPQEALTEPQTRKFIITKPALDYSSLQPGEEATKIIRQMAQELNLTSDQGISIRLSGPVALNDQEFASVEQGTGFATILSGGLVLVLLFFAMRTWRIILPIALTLLVGLITSTAFATVAVGSLNLISVAFAVMFIGIAVDFGIQFGIRYRDQHHIEPDHAKALARTAKIIAIPLSMAAGSTTLGFLSFIPTEYRGVSELGLIAGGGMVIAFFLNLTLLPALMSLIKTPPEPESVGYECFAPLNNFLMTKGKIILPFIVGITIAGVAITSQIRFDFDPLDLKDPHTESVSTMFDVMQDPNSDAYAVQTLAPSLDAAQQLAAMVQKLPQVDHVMTLASFVPDEQDKKLAMIADTGTLLAPTLALPHLKPPSDAENLEALRKAAATLHQAGDKIPSAQNLAHTLDALVAQSNPELLKRAQANIISPLQEKFAQIDGLLQTHAVTIHDIPDALKDDWVTKDGRYLVEIFPKRGADNNPRNLDVLTKFIDAVQGVVPDATGSPVSIRESGRTIVSAFVHAGIYGLLSIGLLSFLMMRRLRDVVLMLIPLIMAGILTLATITVIGMPLNFANIIALPLLLSLGVSYAVYFVSYWRTGRQDLLQSSMARAVMFSAATVLVAFVSLCFSAHPGTRGMGELLTISLVYSLICTFFILPVLLSLDKRYH